MKKKILSVFIVCMLCFGFTACGKKVPEAVESLQHKIDKTLESESTPDYEDIVEIEELYDDLLNEEQSMITNYDKIKAMYAIDSNLVSCVYAANDLKDRLKNPNSLEIISAECYNEGEDTTVKIEYSAENIVGGTKEDDYYCIVNTPTENNGQWYCTLKPIFYYVRTTNGESEAQYNSMIRFSKGGDNVVEVNAKQIMDNLNMTIIDE